jgi:hypothetical protein
VKNVTVENVGDLEKSVTFQRGDLVGCSNVESTL